MNSSLHMMQDYGAALNVEQLMVQKNAKDI